jgi:putative transposase
MVDPDHARLSITQQCQLVSIPRSSYYYESKGESALNLELLEVIDRQFLLTPFFGSRQMTRHLRRQGYCIGRKRVRRLMKVLAIQALYQRPRTSDPNPEHRIYPYLLRDLEVKEPNQVWCADVTYIPMKRGFLYLVAIMDWASRRVLAWRLSNSLEPSFCVEALEEALERYGPPEIMNTDQGSQFTGLDFIRTLERAGVRISMDGKGRWMDNVFIERLWRSLKYEKVYLAEFQVGSEAREAIAEWIHFYNHQRPHSSLDDRTPNEAYLQQPAPGSGTDPDPTQALAA